MGICEALDSLMNEASFPTSVSYVNNDLSFKIKFTLQEQEWFTNILMWRMLWGRELLCCCAMYSGTPLKGHLVNQDT